MLIVGRKYSGPCYRVETGLLIHGRNAQEIVDFEAEELDNIDTRIQAEKVAKDFNLKLEDIDYRDAVWVCFNKEDVEMYCHDGGEISEFFVEDALMLAEDFQGGYLIFTVRVDV